jgi:hypothetical protein
MFHGHNTLGESTLNAAKGAIGLPSSSFPNSKMQQVVTRPRNKTTTQNTQDDHYCQLACSAKEENSVIMYVFAPRPRNKTATLNTRWP